jgi:hypothetical protein
MPKHKRADACAAANVIPVYNAKKNGNNSIVEIGGSRNACNEIEASRQNKIVAQRKFSVIIPR